MNKKVAFLSAALTAMLPVVNAVADTTSTTATDSTVSTTEQTSSPSETREFRREREPQRQANEALRAQNQAQRAELKDAKEQNQADKQQRTEDRCQKIQSRLSDKVAQAQTNKQNFGIAFTNMQARLQRLSERLASKNIDVTQLNKDIATLGTKIDKLKQDHDAFLANLIATQAAAPDACGTSQGKFIGQLESSRTSSLALEKDRLDIRSFFQDTIRPEIMAIRAQLEKQATTVDSSAATIPTTETAAE